MPPSINSLGLHLILSVRKRLKAVRFAAAAFQVLEQKKKEEKEKQRETEASGGDAAVGETWEPAQPSRETSLGDSDVDR